MIEWFKNPMETAPLEEPLLFYESKRFYVGQIKETRFGKEIWGCWGQSNHQYYGTYWDSIGVFPVKTGPTEWAYLVPPVERLVEEWKENKRKEIR